MTETEKKVFARSSVLTPAITHYCPGCGHGIVHRLVAEVIEHYGIRGRTVGVAPVGCAVMANKYIDVDMIEAAHGRAPAVATGIKRARPELAVFTYQGDGDLAADRHRRNRSCGESRREHHGHLRQQRGLRHDGRANGPDDDPRPENRHDARGTLGANDGGPIRVCEMLGTLDGPSYIARVTIDKPAAVRKAKQAIVTAFGRQLDGKGFSLVEVLSPCPTYWRLPPAEAMAPIGDWMVKNFPLGVFKDKEAASGKTAEA